MPPFFQYFLPPGKTSVSFSDIICFCLQPQLRMAVRTVVYLFVAEINSIDPMLTECITVLERLAQVAEPAL